MVWREGRITTKAECLPQYGRAYISFTLVTSKGYQSAVMVGEWPISMAIEETDTHQEKCLHPNQKTLDINSN